LKFKWNYSGKEGEDVAVSYLIDKGYTIVDTRYKAVGVEIDIIAEKDDTISFIEVKTRKSDAYGFPEEYVNKAKAKRIIRGANFFLSFKKNEKYDDYFKSIDVISIMYGSGNYEIELIENAYEENW
jgi:putative endonuclease